MYSKLKLTKKNHINHNTIIDIKGTKIGGNNFVTMAGPCAIESKEQINNIAKEISQSGAHILRGGAFKPRTSPYDFQGLGIKGLEYLKDAARTHNLLCISELMDTVHIEYFEKYVDIIQIGARNMQNYSLLKSIGHIKKPILLKRGLCSTYHELLMAAEYIMSSGNENVILCERGIRTFEPYTRNTLDLISIPILKELTHLPVIIDPSHGIGIRSIIPSAAKAALTLGSNGIIIEAHTDPSIALSDAAQTISTKEFKNMMGELTQLQKYINRQD